MYLSLFVRAASLTLERLHDRPNAGEMMPRDIGKNDLYQTKPKYTKRHACVVSESNTGGHSNLTGCPWRLICIFPNLYLIV